MKISTFHYLHSIGDVLGTLPPGTMNYFSTVYPMVGLDVPVVLDWPLALGHNPELLQ